MSALQPDELGCCFPSPADRGNSESPPRIAIANSQPMMLEVLVQTVRQVGAVVPFTATSASEARERAREAVPDGMLFAFDLPDRNGAHLFAHLRREQSGLWGLALGDAAIPAHLALTHRAGALGFLSRTLTCSALAAALQRALAGQALWKPEQVDSADQWWAQFGAPWQRLSPRQRQVAWAVAQRLGHKQTAFWLGIRESTVKTHLKTILAKTELPSREDLTMWMRAGRLEDPLVYTLLGLEGPCPAEADAHPLIERVARRTGGARLNAARSRRAACGQ